MHANGGVQGGGGLQFVEGYGAADLPNTVNEEKAVRSPTTPAGGGGSNPGGDTPASRVPKRRRTLFAKGGDSTGVNPPCSPGGLEFMMAGKATHKQGEFSRRRLQARTLSRQDSAVEQEGGAAAGLADAPTTNG